MNNDTPIACDMTALTITERNEHQRLLASLLAATTATMETADGFRLSLDPERLSVADAGSWIGLEARCCPFLRFELTVEGDEVAVRLSGPDGVKPFLVAELGLAV